TDVLHAKPHWYRPSQWTCSGPSVRPVQYPDQPCYVEFSLFFPLVVIGIHMDPGVVPQPGTFVARLPTGAGTSSTVCQPGEAATILGRKFTARAAFSEATSSGPL